MKLLIIISINILTLITINCSKTDSNNNHIHNKSQKNNHITITAVGDIFITKRFIKNKQLKKIKLNGDVVFGNFEGTINTPNAKIRNDKLNLIMPSNIPLILNEMDSIL